ncbi:hypothetical protein ES703_90797 [subsurface metagenome]
MKSSTLSANERREKVKRIIERVYKEERVNVNELRMGSRRENISQVRSHLAFQLVEDYALSLAETARQLGVSTSA